MTQNIMKSPYVEEPEEETEEEEESFDEDGCVRKKKKIFDDSLMSGEEYLKIILKQRSDKMSET